MNQAELDIVLREHAKWLAGESGARADLRWADLREANLVGANLREANLVGADLYGADLREADLCWADLYGADLREADLCWANLREADLRGADLRGADLRGADLRGADLYGADLYGANLREANLREANLCGANLHYCVGNMVEVRSMQCDTWHVAWTSDTMAIGCQQHTLDEWWSFSDEVIHDMASGALEWWRKWKPLLQQIIEASR